MVQREEIRLLHDKNASCSFVRVMTISNATLNRLRKLLALHGQAIGE
jgi:hypothetical protein